ncbi:hypothetical protein FQR65_LT20563 [Abscondita terminalis]|nr:hypothetical protein FQR65_LT20563 [Abscondita terminalis]
MIIITTHLLGPLGTDTQFAETAKNFNYFLAALARLVPYFERACLRSLTPWVSKAPRTNVITHTRQIFYTTAAQQHDAMFLQVVALTADIRNNFENREIMAEELNQRASIGTKMKDNARRNLPGRKYNTATKERLSPAELKIENSRVYPSKLWRSRTVFKVAAAVRWRNCLRAQRHIPLQKISIVGRLATMSPPNPWLSSLPGWYATREKLTTCSTFACHKNSTEANRSALWPDGVPPARSTPDCANASQSPDPAQLNQANSWLSVFLQSDR